MAQQYLPYKAELRVGNQEVRRLVTFHQNSGQETLRERDK